MGYYPSQWSYRDYADHFSDNYYNYRVGESSSLAPETKPVPNPFVSNRRLNLED